MSRMGSSTLWGKITVLIAVCGWCLSVQAKYGGGSGTQAEPFRIGAVSDWEELMASPGDWASHFVLTGDIDLNDVPITPVGNDANNFTGVFDGNDYVIRNVDVNMPGRDYVGLFGCFGTGGQIRNLCVEDTSIFGSDYVGGLVGRNYGTISDCYSTGSVSGTGSYVGGLVGSNYFTLTNGYSTGSVSGRSHVGGLVGYNYEGTISNCYSTGSVSGTGSYVGGLVGYNNRYGAISNCYSAGSVGGTGSYFGGLVGWNTGAISGSFWDVNTSGRTTSDGGTGRTTAQMQDIDTFLDSGWDFVGEKANGTCSLWLMPETGGYPVLSILNGYIPAEPSGSGSEADPYIISDANELGTVWYRPSACYVMVNDIDLAGISWSGAVVPFFSGVFDGNGYVIRNADVNMPGGDYVGLFGLLGTGGQIKNLGVEDIWTLGRANVGCLVGVNDGTISECYSTGSVSGTDFVGGLVGYNYDGTITNCYSTGSVSVSGDYFAGGLVGLNYSGTINNCYSTGSVTSDNEVGGLVGSNYSGTISNCYSAGSVRGSWFVGGLVGSNRGSISSCYSTGSVNGTSYVGGLVGANGGTISDCYSTGFVAGAGSYFGGLVGSSSGGISGSFWDVNTSGRTTSAGGTPKTRTEMKTQGTFTSAGWDFIGETVNGPNDIWRMCVDAVHYPRLTWAYVQDGDFACPDGVNAGDLMVLCEDWLSSYSQALYGADANGDKHVTFADFAILAQRWLSDL